jgi:hypothetical protein
MKTTVLPNDINIRKRFFLLMIVPLLIGFMISLTSFAHAEWNKQDDPLLNQSPSKQGWEQMETHSGSSDNQKVALKS